MIIVSIRAQNVLRYAELSIDLAERGLIAISGQNESGKSSIGETLCFALFGRTFSVPPEDLRRVVRWGEDDCSVTIEFAVEDTHYLLSRFLDRDGNHSAKLARVDDPENPVARGVSAVGDALFKIVGYAYDEFVESFYLAQREITTPHPHSHAIKIMAGIAPLEYVTHSLGSEIAEREEVLGEIQAEWYAVEGDIQALGIEEGLMAGLEDKRHESAKQLDKITTLTAEIQHGLDTWETNTRGIHRARGARGRASFLRVVVSLLALAAAALWALLTFASDSPLAATAHDVLVKYLPQWDISKRVWIGYVAAGLVALFLLLWARASSLQRRIARLRAEAGQIGEVLARTREIGSEPIVEGDEDGLAQAPPRPEDAEYEALRQQLDQGEPAARMAHDYSERELTWLDHVGTGLSSQIETLDEQIENERVRLQEVTNLSDVLVSLRDRREDIQERIADRRRGIELLEAATVHLANQFNRDIKDLVARMLPLFTDGRYQHLQIDSELRVRMFSSEKLDFIDLDEVSSGTQRQVMLALRLALSKKLLSRTVKGRQFAFLDEPFAFFDEERTCRALKALADLGDDISQVWIVAQDFPEVCDVAFDTKVDCKRASDVLTVLS
jgi:exonuclease SbcC